MDHAFSVAGFVEVGVVCYHLLFPKEKVPFESIPLALRFWTAWLSGECLIYFGEIMLLVVFM